MVRYGGYVVLVIEYDVIDEGVLGGYGGYVGFLFKIGFVLSLIGRGQSGLLVEGGLDVLKMLVSEGLNSWGIALCEIEGYRQDVVGKGVVGVLFDVIYVGIF